MLSSVSAGAVVVVSDIADAGVPKENAAPEKLAMIEQQPIEVKPSPELKVTKKKAAKKKSRLDFGRFDGY